MKLRKSPRLAAMVCILACLLYLAWPAITVLRNNTSEGDLSLLTLASFTILLLICCGYVIDLLLLMIGLLGAVLFTASGDLPGEIIRKLRAAFSICRKR